MIAPAIRDWIRNRLASMVRLTTIRGRDSKGVYSCDGYRHPDDPESVVVAKRAQHYGFCSEPPSDGTCVAVAVAVGGGASNRVAVAEYSTNTPEIEEGEVVLWTKFGQKILLDKDGNVIIVPKAGGSVILGNDTGSGTDRVVTESRLQAILDTIKTHTHAVAGAVAGASAQLAVPGAVTIVGSPNVLAKT